MSRTRNPATSDRLCRPLLIAHVAALLCGLGLTVPTEIHRLQAAVEMRLGAPAWFFEFNLDTTLPFIVLAVAPVLWMVRRKGTSTEADGEAAAAFPAFGERGRDAWIMALSCAALSIAASAWVASSHVGGDPSLRLGELPPAYHDEFSYLLQAKTFLAGRLSFPSHSAMPEIFDQMHVVNEGRFASRYFPGVGLWIAPFLAVGCPYWGQWLAGGLASFFTFWAGRELSGNRVGLMAGLLTALSPGMALFSNLLLSHHPTMAALCLFLFAFLRFMRTGRPIDALIAGCGLTFAMLCRPMTAAGFGLPFGMWLLWRLASRGRAASGLVVAEASRGRGHQPCGWSAPDVFPSLIAMAAPILLGLASLFFYNRAITGNGLVSPYQLYTDTYTPRHVYGFNNVERGERRLGPKVLDNYDRWAENLTPRLAAQNVGKRLEAGARWTLGIVPLALAAIGFAVFAMWKLDRRWRLVAAAVVSLHAVHVPYWFVGIMDWHYVFETGPLLLLILAATSAVLWDAWRNSGRFWMPGWWAALIASAVVTNWVPFDPFWSPSRIEQGVEEIAFARLRYEGVQRMIDQAVLDRPALLLIEGDPADRSIDYVVNDSALDGPVIRGRYRPGVTDLRKVGATFPERRLYLFRVASGELRKIGR